MDRVQVLADRLIAARRTGKSLQLAPGDDGPETRDEVHRIQSIVQTAMGPVGAFKVGWFQPGDGEPFLAPIFAADLKPSPAAYSADLPRRFGIELEIAFRVVRPLPPVGAPDFETQARASLEALPVIEIVDSRISDFEAAGPLWKLADNQLNTGVVMGPAMSDWSGLDTTGGRVRLTAGDRVIAEGRRETPGGDAYRNFCALARAVGDHCGGLQVGHVVITGSLMGLAWVDGPAQVVGEIAGLGRVEAARG